MSMSFPAVSPGPRSYHALNKNLLINTNKYLFLFVENARLSLPYNVSTHSTKTVFRILVLKLCNPKLKCGSHSTSIGAKF